MRIRVDHFLEPGELFCAEGAWSLDELDRLADLDSVRAARSRTDDAGG